MRRLKKAWDWLRGFRYDPDSEHCPEAQRYIWRCEREGREASPANVWIIDDWYDVMARFEDMTMPKIRDDLAGMFSGQSVECLRGTHSEDSYTPWEGCGGIVGPPDVCPTCAAEGRTASWRYQPIGTPYIDADRYGRMFGELDRGVLLEFLYAASDGPVSTPDLREEGRARE